MSLVPIYIFEKEGVLPDSGTFYVIGSNGSFLHKDTGIVKGLVKVDKIPGLGFLEPSIEMNLPKIPASVVYRCLVFFRRVWYQHQSEAALVLWYKKETEEYYLHCPVQFVSHGGVSYDPGLETSPQNVAFVNEMRRGGYKKVGTVHSHCNFGAYHSGVDTADEAKFDGVHITIGDVDKQTFSLASSLVVNDNRWPVDPQSVMLGIEPRSQSAAKGRRMTYHTPDKWYNMALGDEEKEQIVNDSLGEIEQSWMPKVTKRPPYQFAYEKKGWYTPSSSYGGTGEFSTSGFPDNDVSAVDDALEDESFYPQGDFLDEQEDEPPLEEVTGDEPPLEEVTGDEPPLEEVTGDEPPQEEVTAEAFTPESPKVFEEETPPKVAEVPPGELPLEAGGPSKDERYLRQVRSAAYALHQHGDAIPPDRVRWLRRLLQGFFCKSDVTAEDIKVAMEINPKKEGVSTK